MKKYFLTVLAVVVAMVADAAPRSAQQALELAERFVAANMNFAKHRNASLTLSSSSVAEVKAKGVVETPAYYVCNVDGGNGFVVVSGDDRFKEILGYSMSGAVEDGGDMPDGLKYWLDFLAREMEAAKVYYDANGIEALSKTRSAVQPMHEDIAPLLTTQWDQMSPYNDLCPMTANGRSVTGCVATGMAQIMNYYEYPVKGIGSHTNAYFASQTMNFGETTYDWANMSDTYNAVSTEAQKTAVATLMAHCGCAVDMRYTAEVSGTPNIYAGIALVNYFGYNPNIHYAGRDYMSGGAWKDLLLEELAAGRPLAYSGMTGADSGEGHFFVCDGYESATGKFHFNWGWSGRFDGYYELSSLEPGTGGVGAGTGSFNYYQSVIVGLQPEATGEYETHFEMSTFKPKSTSYNQGAQMEFVMTNLTNNTINFSGEIGLAVYKDGALFETFMDAVPTGLVPGAYATEISYFCKFPSKYTPGVYRVCMVAKRSGSDKLEVIRANYGTPTYWDAEVTGAEDYMVKFTAVTDDYYITDAGVAPVIVSDKQGYAYVNGISKFEVTIRNEGTTEFYDEAGVVIYQRNREKARFTEPVRLAPGEQKTIEVGGLVTLAEGDYTVYSCYMEDESCIPLDEEIALTVRPESENSIEAVAGAVGRVVSVEYYNLSGVRLAAPQRGVTIRKTEYENGTVVSEKMMVNK